MSVRARSVGVHGAAAAVVLGLLTAALGGCDATTPEERGEALFSDPSISNSSRNAASCSTCHVPDEVLEDEWYSGGSLRGVAGRPSYFGGEVRELRSAVNTCLRYFMRHPDEVPLREDDPRGLDLLAYLNSLGTAPSEAVPFTIQRTVVDNLPEGDAAHGEVVYEGGCSTCHGDKDTGVGRKTILVTIIPTATITEHGMELARIASIEKVRHGGFYGAGGDMAPFSLEALSDQELADVLAYLGY